MFGIGGMELLFIVVVILMLFGSEKVPEIARGLGKMMAQLKNATNDLKNEIQKSATESGMDMKNLTGGISEEINKAKEEIKKVVNPIENITSEIENPIEKVKEDIETLTGPIKRQL